MKPETSSSSFNPEQIAAQSNPGVERFEGLDSADSNIEKSAEKYEQKAESSAIMSDVGLTTVIPTPVIDEPVVNKTTIISDNPVTAADDDLIEKEWVDKAKKIVAETQNDPYRQEDEVSKLQIDYIKKRYGRELGTAE